MQHFNPYSILQMQHQQQQVIAKLHDQNRKLHQKLRQAELETKKAARQKDQRKNLNMKKVIQTELQNSIVSRGRNDSLELELKKFIKAEINEFLISKDWPARTCSIVFYGCGLETI